MPLAALPPEKIVRLSHGSPSDRELTLYVKGFLTRGEKAEHFDAWHRSHYQLEERFGWGPRVYGYCWPSGRIDNIPPPLLISARALLAQSKGTRGMARLSVAGNVGMAVAEELAQVIAAFGQQYELARRSASERADALAKRLLMLRGRYGRLRVVGHSLGCLHVIEALALLKPDQRPDIVHLCAPACTESELEGRLDNLGREAAFLYHARSDLVLRLGFPGIGSERALGSVGVKRAYAGLTPVDVREHFRFWVHLQYKNRFERFARDVPTA
jgi:hypothetical protein